MSLTENNIEANKSEISFIKEKLAELKEKMTIEQIEFCDHYVMNVTQSAFNISSVVFPEKENTKELTLELIENENVQEYLKLKKELHKLFFITKNEILLHAYDILLKSKEKQPILDRHGQPTGHFTSDIKNASKILEILCKAESIIESGNKIENLNLPILPDIKVDSNDLDKFYKKFNEDF
jgi:hypothetical protein